LDSDEEPLVWPRMQDAWERQVAVGDRLHSSPRKSLVGCGHVSGLT
jgi:hypothetical protein